MLVDEYARKLAAENPRFAFFCEAWIRLVFIRLGWRCRCGWSRCLGWAACIARCFCGRGFCWAFLALRTQLQAAGTDIELAHHAGQASELIQFDRPNNVDYGQ